MKRTNTEKIKRVLVVLEGNVLEWKKSYEPCGSDSYSTTYHCKLKSNENIHITFSPFTLWTESKAIIRYKGETVEMKMNSSYFFDWGLDDFEREVEYILKCVDGENNKNAFERLFG
jgi:hypothetical protein